MGHYVVKDDPDNGYRAVFSTVVMGIIWDGSVDDIVEKYLVPELAHINEMNAGIGNGAPEYTVEESLAKTWPGSISNPLVRGSAEWVDCTGGY